MATASLEIGNYDKYCVRASTYRWMVQLEIRLDVYEVAWWQYLLKQDQAQATMY